MAFLYEVSHQVPTITRQALIHNHQYFHINSLFHKNQQAEQYIPTSDITCD